MSISDSMVDYNSSSFTNMQQAIDILLYGNGLIPKTTNPTVAERALVFSAKDAANINAQLMYMIANFRKRVWSGGSEEIKDRASGTGFISPSNAVKRISGTFQIPVDSFQETFGGSRMLIRIQNRYDSSTSPTNQRSHDEVYQTPRFSSPHPYRDCQTGLAVSGRVRKNDANRPLLSDIQDLPLSTHVHGHPPVGDSVQ
jgi:hypothetical protein